MQYNSYSRRPARRRSSKRWLLLLLPILVIGGIVYWLVAGGNRAEAPEVSQQSETSSQEEQKSTYTPINLQPTVDAWVNKQAADYHIVVHDLQSGTDIATNDPDTPLFAASLYKIYIAYLMYKDFQTGAQNPDEILSQGRTKRKCADAMIRSSDSPCGEAAMADMGSPALNQRAAEEIGTTGTFFNGIRTSAADAAKVLELIASKKDLNDQNTTALLDSMLTQEAKFKRGLQTGAPEAKWETKVGWNEDANYHDIGIMTMPDGRKFAVTILGQGSGSSKPIADFAATIYSALTL